MRGALLLAVLITVSTASMGCEDTPAAKIASSPILVMDYIAEQDTVKIYLHGATDHRYDRLYLQVDNVTMTDTEVLMLCMNVKDVDTFNLSASATDGKDVYSAEMTVDVLPNKDEAFHIDMRKGGTEKVDTGDLPWKHRLEES